GGSAGHALGGSVHRALQVFHERGGTDELSQEELVDHLHQKGSEQGYGSPEEAAAHLAAGEDLPLRYYRSAAAAGRETVWTERTVQQRYDEFVLFGKIDRLDRCRDGSLEVVDYKTGRLSVTEEEVRDSLAIRIYQLLIAREHPGVPVYAGIYCLRTGA